MRAIITRFSYLPGVSVILGNWLPCSYIVWSPSWSVGALIFGVFLSLFLFIIYHLLLSLAILFVLPYDTNMTGPCISFTFFLWSKISMYSASLFCFSFSTSPTILCQFEISLLFFPASYGPSGPIFHQLICPCTDGRSSVFQSFSVCFMGSPFCSSIVPLWTHWFIAGFMNVASYIVY